MSKGKMLLIVNPLLGLAVVVQAVTGAMMKNHVSPGELWEGLHVAFAVALVVLTVAHLALNWHWVRVNILKKKAKQS